MIGFTHRARAICLTAALVLGGAGTALFTAAPAQADAATCNSDLTTASNDNSGAYYYDSLGEASTAAGWNTDTATALADAAVACLGQDLGVTTAIVDATSDTAEALTENVAGDIPAAEVDEELTYDDIALALSLVS